MLAALLLSIAMCRGPARDVGVLEAVCKVRRGCKASLQKSWSHQRSGEGAKYTSNGRHLKCRIYLKSNIFCSPYLEKKRPALNISILYRPNIIWILFHIHTLMVQGLKIHKICLPANNLNLLFQGHTNAHNASHHQGSRTTWRKCGDSECYDKMINWSWLLHLSQPCQPFPQTPSSWSLDSQAPVCKGHLIRIHEVIILDKRKKERIRNVLAWACLFPGSSWSKALIYLSAVAYSCNNHKAIAIVFIEIINQFMATDLQSGISYWEVIQVVSLISFLPILREITFHVVNKQRN